MIHVGELTNTLAPVAGATAWVCPTLGTLRWFLDGAFYTTHDARLALRWAPGMAWTDANGLRGRVWDVGREWIDVDIESGRARLETDSAGRPTGTAQGVITSVKTPVLPDLDDPMTRRWKTGE